MRFFGRHFIGSMFAIGVAGVAAVAATSAWLSSPMNIGPPPGDKPVITTPPPGQTPPATPDGKPAVPEGGAKPAPADIPDAPSRGETKPQPSGGEASPDVAKAPDDDKDDKDPYEGIAPEELPPDLQYSADSSVSFPTNI
jgi:hypothetical protein